MKIEDIVKLIRGEFSPADTTIMVVIAFLQQLPDFFKFKKTQNIFLNIFFSSKYYE